ncbi:MAG TPA: radical SAM protein [Candidatus Gastranaerophilales bacterium]|nr:radical SAM protein [Candidatus Gastranaerophilales bacterium]
MKRILLFYPPIGLYQRGEDRCQANMEGSASGSVRACNDLGYMASVARKLGFEPKLMDYPAESMRWDNYINDIKQFKPDFIVMSITTATIEKDMEAFKIAKELLPEVISIAKGAHFYSCKPEELNKNIYNVMDYAISGEAEFIIADLLKALLEKQPVNEVKGIFYRNQNNIVKTRDYEYVENLDDLPFPARDLMNNKLYQRPDSGKPMATISVSRGCPFPCFYCLTPIVSGKKLRKRTSQNIVDELQECVEKHGIKDFFFKADTFTVDRNWVIEVCREITRRNLKISWGTSARVKPLDEEMLKIMKQAGCWLMALGIESANDETLKEIKKGATKQDAVNAVKMIHKAGIKIYGYYMIGFPWETRQHIEETIKFAKQLNCEFIEFHIAVPFEGTEYYNRIKGTKFLEAQAIGHDSYLNPAIRTDFLTSEEILELKNRALKEICLSPAYILQSLKNIKSLKEFLNYSKYGLRMVKNILRK